MTQPGARITINNQLQLQVPDDPIVPFYRRRRHGSGHLAGERARVRRGGRKGIRRSAEDQWKEVLAGEKAFKQVNNWLPDETLDAFRTYLVGIKGPLTTPVGGGIRSLNVALRQVLDLVCLFTAGALVPRRALAGEASGRSTP